MMLILSLIALGLAAPAVLAQDSRNLSYIVGTWSSGSQAVVTGAVGIIIDLTVNRSGVFNCGILFCRALQILKT